MLMVIIILIIMKKQFSKNKLSASRKRRLQRVRKGAVRQLRVLNLHRNVGIDREAKRVVDIAVDPRRHPGLNQKISNNLLGFDGSTQNFMAEAIALYVGGHAVTMTCLAAVDALLRKFYREIDALQSNAG